MGNLKPATTAEVGLRSRKCLREGCGKEETEEIPFVEEYALKVRVTRTTGDPIPNAKGLTVVVKDGDGNVVASEESESPNFKLTGNDYTVEVENLPKGFYCTESEYPVKIEDKDALVVIRAEARLNPEAVTSSTAYKVGDILNDQTLEIIGSKSSEDRKVKISELLKKYKGIFFSLYYRDCGGCQSELGSLVNAYGMTSSTGKPYSSEIAIVMLALGTGYETKESIRTFKNAYSLPTMMAYCNDLERALMRAEKSPAYPTSIAVDAEGYIFYKITEVAESPSFFTQRFEQILTYYKKIESTTQKSASDQAVNGTIDALLPETSASPTKKKEDA